MKKLAFLFILVALSYRCSEINNGPNESTEGTLSPNLQIQLQHLSRTLSAVWENQLRLMPRKVLTSAAGVSNLLEATRAVLDERQQIFFDAAINHPEMQKFVNWGKAMLDSKPTFSGGRVGDIWDFNSVTSAVARGMLMQLKSDIEYTMSSMEGASQQSITTAVTNTVYYFELSVYSSTTLTQTEKDLLGGAVNLLYGSISLIVQNALYEYIPENQNKTQWNWKKCWKVVASVALVVAACAVAAGAVAGIIWAISGAAELMLPASVLIFGWEVEFATASMAIGGAVGLAVGSGMALSDVCVYSYGPGFNLGTESCSI